MEYRQVGSRVGRLPRQRQLDGLALWVAWMVENGSFGMSYEYVERWSFSYKFTERELLKMQAVWMANVMMAMGIFVSVAGAVRAMKRAGERHRSQSEALNDQETWCDAVEQTREMAKHRYY